MRTLKNLVLEHQEVYIYCGSERSQESFLKQICEEGFMTLNGQKPTELMHQKYYGIRDDMTAGYVSNMCWSLSARTGISDPHFRIDYDRYISGEDDFIRHTLYVTDDSIKTFHNLSHRMDNFDDVRSLPAERFTYTEYNAYIYRELTDFLWHDSPESAIKLISREQNIIRDCYYKNISASCCAVDAGYCCG